MQVMTDESGSQASLPVADLFPVPEATTLFHQNSNIKVGPNTKVCITLEIHKKSFVHLLCLNYREECLLD